MMRRLWIAIAFLLWMTIPAAAQGFMLRGFGDVGSTTFTASDSFDAVLGSAGGMVLGGGVETVLPGRMFVNLRVSRFRAAGERVFVFEGQQFDLGIPTTISVTPVELTGGYRFDFGQRLVPYAGGGVGWHAFEESSEFAEPDENARERFRGYHLVGGAEVRVTRWLGIGGEAQWATVPDALGRDPNSVSAAFEETDLGGTTFRLKIVVGN